MLFQRRLISVVILIILSIVRSNPSKFITTPEIELTNENHPSSILDRGMVLSREKHGEELHKITVATASHKNPDKTKYFYKFKWPFYAAYAAVTFALAKALVWKIFKIIILKFIFLYIPKLKYLYFGEQDMIYHFFLNLFGLEGQGKFILFFINQLTFVSTYVVYRTYKS